MYKRQGSTLVSPGFNNVDPNIIELLRFEIAEIARVYGVPQSLIGHHEKGSSIRNANIVTADFNSLKKKALIPYSRSIISEVQKKLVIPAMRLEQSRFGVKKELSFEFDFRINDESSEMETTMVLKNMAQSGVYTINELRKREGYPPLPDGDRLPGITGAPKQQQNQQFNGNALDRSVADLLQ